MFSTLYASLVGGEGVEKEKKKLIFEKGILRSVHVKRSGLQ